MSSLQMYLRIILRRKTATALVVLFAAATTVFLLLYPSLIQRTEAELDRAYNSVTVSGWVLNAKGYADPIIRPSLWHMLEDTGMLQQVDVRASRRGSFPTKDYLSTLCPDHAPGSEELAQFYHGWMADLSDIQVGESYTDPYGGELIGVSGFNSDEALLKQRASIQWAPGYDESFFRSEEKGVVVSDDLGYALGETVTMALDMTGYVPYQMKVVGIIPGGNPYTHYCPAHTLENIYIEKDWHVSFRLTKMSFVVADNRRLDEFKNIVRTTGYSSSLHISIDDRTLQGTIGPIRSNLEMLQGLYVIFFVVVGIIGFFLCFLLFRNRRQEFAVMRLLGETGKGITGKALLEQTLLCVLGIALGAILVAVGGLGQFSALTCGGVLLCYSIGSALAVMLMVRVNVMEILRDKE